MVLGSDPETGEMQFRALAGGFSPTNETLHPKPYDPKLCKRNERNLTPETMQTKPYERNVRNVRNPTPETIRSKPYT